LAIQVFAKVMVKGILGIVGGAPTDSNILFGFGIAAVSVSGSPVTRRGAGSMGVWCPARLLSVGITAQVAVRVLIEDCLLNRRLQPRPTLLPIYVQKKRQLL
jgi:hypothetical protein